MNGNRLSHRFGNVVPGKKRPATIHLVQSSRFAKNLAKLLILGILVSILGMMLLPWQQTSPGTGQVVAYAPQERQQSIESQAKGIVVKITEGLVEGSEVAKDDIIMEIQPFAANMVSQLNGQLNDLKTKLESANVKAEAYGQNVQGFTEARDLGVAAYKELVEAAKAKLESKQQQVSAYVAKELQAKLNLDRQTSLFKEGLKPEKEIEKLKKEWDVAQAELRSVREDVISLKRELAAKKTELEEKRRVAQTKIDYARAMQQDAIGAAATVQKDIRDVELKLETMQRLVIRAPKSGTIFRMPVQQGQAIKEGDPLVTLIPESSQNAVELFVNGNDMPLIQLGQEVRLQFEGWPAVQFAGWPSVAVGTFSGTVTTIDATDNGKGQFRILITPNGVDQKWPSDRFLRQGVRANGWVMLKQVRLGYEIWRQLNGFPVIMSDEEPKKDKSKPPKLPK